MHLHRGMGDVVVGVEEHTNDQVRPSGVLMYELHLRMETETIHLQMYVCMCVCVWCDCMYASTIYRSPSTVCSEGVWKSIRSSLYQLSEYVKKPCTPAALMSLPVCVSVALCAKLFGRAMEPS